MNADKQFYDSTVTDLSDLSFVDNIVSYAGAWSRGAEMFPRNGMAVLDLGAGSCTTSLMLSKKPQVSHVVASDISSKKMQQIAPIVCERVGGNFAKLSFVESDFNELLPFQNEEFDIVVMDAALHHSRNIWVTLAEIRRVLKRDGVFVAQREAYASPLTHRITFQRILASPEAAAQVSENAYLISQYDYYLRVNGFKPKFYPVYPNWKFRSFWFLNGLVFSKYNIISTRI